MIDDVLKARFEQLSRKIDSIDWTVARDDVQRFLPHPEQDALRNWERPMFQYHAKQLREYTVVSR